jgi:hypothetical protein
MRRDRFLHALKLDHDGPLIQSSFVRFYGCTASQKAAASRLDGRTGELRIFSERGGVRNGAVESNPISFGHFVSPEIRSHKMVAASVRVRPPDFRQSNAPQARLTSAIGGHERGTLGT